MFLCRTLVNLGVFLFQDPILRFFNLQLQRQRCSSLEEMIFFSKRARLPVGRGVVKIYNAGVVTRDRRIGSRNGDISEIFFTNIFLWLSRVILRISQD
jgi:hypothetical protein